LYGSSRLGIWQPNQRLTPSVDTSKKWQIREGQKRYELTNHLGNVLVTISDRRQGAAPASQQFTYYEAVVITATDYYPFGMSMPNRDFKLANTEGYRYSFNGKEDDNEWGVQDYGERFYDEQYCRFWSVDPIASQYPELTPYQFASNTPICAIDLDGLEMYNPFTGVGFGPLSQESIKKLQEQGQFLVDGTTGKSYLPVYNAQQVKQNVEKQSAAIRKMLDKLYKREGSVYEDVKDDPGGPTKFGIAYYKNWKEAAKLLGIKSDLVSLKTLTKEQADKYYIEGRLKPLGFDKISSELVGDALFDQSALGANRVVRNVRLVLNEMGYKFKVTDKKLSEKEVDAINALDAEDFTRRFLNKQEQSYRDVAESNKKTKKFLQGWLNRLDSLRINIPKKEDKK
jgi:RHS repeat-associated protein